MIIDLIASCLLVVISFCLFTVRIWPQKKMMPLSDPIRLFFNGIILQARTIYFQARILYFFSTVFLPRPHFWMIDTRWFSASDSVWSSTSSLQKYFNCEELTRAGLGDSALLFIKGTKWNCTRKLWRGLGETALKSYDRD